MRLMGCLPGFGMREAAPGTLADSVVLYGVELADIEGRTLSSMDTAAAKAMWGPTPCSWAKEVLPGLLARGFHVSPLWQAQYQCLLWLTRWACTLGTTSTLVQAVLKCRTRRPPRGPWAGPCKPPASRARSGARGGGTGMCRGRGRPYACGSGRWATTPPRA